MRSFENCQVTKKQLLYSLNKHREYERIVQGYYWYEGRGCAIGCTLHDFSKNETANALSQHIRYEYLFGIPESLAQVEDYIFERSSEYYATEWPIRFVEAINVGSDLSMVKNIWIKWILYDSESPFSGKFHTEWFEELRRLFDLIEGGNDISISEITNVKKSAYLDMYGSEKFIYAILNHVKSDWSRESLSNLASRLDYCFSDRDEDKRIERLETIANGLLLAMSECG